MFITILRVSCQNMCVNSIYPNILHFHAVYSQPLSMCYAPFAPVPPPPPLESLKSCNTVVRGISCKVAVKNELHPVWESRSTGWLRGEMEKDLGVCVCALCHSLASCLLDKRQREAITSCRTLHLLKKRPLT